MIICIKYGGKTHCFNIPYFEIPIKVPPVGPGPVNYPVLFADAVVLGSIQAAAAHISDKGVQAALTQGLHSAVAAMQKRAGGDVTVRAE